MAPIPVLILDDRLGVGRLKRGGGTQDKRMSRCHLPSVIYHQVNNVHEDNRGAGLVFEGHEREEGEEREHEHRPVERLRPCGKRRWI